MPRPAIHLEAYSRSACNLARRRPHRVPYLRPPGSGCKRRKQVPTLRTAAMEAQAKRNDLCDGTDDWRTYPLPGCQRVSDEHVHEPDCAYQPYYFHGRAGAGAGRVVSTCLSDLHHEHRHPIRKTRLNGMVYYLHQTTLEPQADSKNETLSRH